MVSGSGRFRKAQRKVGFTGWLCRRIHKSSENWWRKWRTGARKETNYSTKNITSYHCGFSMSLFAKQNGCILKSSGNMSIVPQEYFLSHLFIFTVTTTVQALSSFSCTSLYSGLCTSFLGQNTLISRTTVSIAFWKSQLDYVISLLKTFGVSLHWELDLCSFWPIRLPNDKAPACFSVLIPPLLWVPREFSHAIHPSFTGIQENYIFIWGVRETEG